MTGEDPEILWEKISRNCHREWQLESIKPNDRPKSIDIKALSSTAKDTWRSDEEEEEDERVNVHQRTKKTIRTWEAFICPSLYLLFIWILSESSVHLTAFSHSGVNARIKKREEDLVINDKSVTCSGSELKKERRWKREVVESNTSPYSLHFPCYFILVLSPNSFFMVSVDFHLFNGHFRGIARRN